MANIVPQVQSTDRLINQLQQNINQVLNPIANNPLVNGSILTSITLIAGLNTINHGLGRTLQGWFLVRNKASSVVHDNQAQNPNTDLTLLLVSTAATIVDVYVF